MKLILTLLILLSPLQAQAPKSHWRAATQQELELALPARATVEKERIETEMRTASGIIDQKKHVIAGVVLITAGYSADGKYSHYLMFQSPVTLGELRLPAGNYVMGWRRQEDVLDVSIYDALTGTLKGTVQAKKKNGPGRVESFHIWPPDESSEFQIGRFFIHYAPQE